MSTIDRALQRLRLWHLSRLAVNANPTHREDAVRRMCHVQDRRALPLLAAMLRDSSPRVRTAAAQALLDRGWNPLEPRERALLEIARGNSAGLELLGTEGLSTVLDNLDFVDVGLLSRILGSDASKAAIESVGTALKSSPRSAQAEQLAEVLCQIATQGNQYAVEVLIDSMRTERVRVLAAEALWKVARQARIGREEALDGLIDVIGWHYADLENNVIWRIKQDASATDVWATRLITAIAAKQSHSSPSEEERLLEAILREAVSEISSDDLRAIAAMEDRTFDVTYTVWSEGRGPRHWHYDSEEVHNPQSYEEEVVKSVVLNRANLRSLAMAELQRRGEVGQG